MNVSLFQNYNAISKPPVKVDVVKVLRRTQNGKHKELIDLIRASKRKAERTILKKKLPCVVFSGYLGNPVKKKKRDTGEEYISYRDDKSLSEHSGLCVVDLDDLGSDNLDDSKELIIKSMPSLFSIFISPSNTGLKAIFKIPESIERHRGHYLAILRDLEKLGFEPDTTSINESRLSFESYDPELYLNVDAVVFEDFIVVEEPEDLKVEGKSFSGLTDYKKLSIAASMIDKAPDGYKHNTLIKASYLMGGYIAGGMVDEDEAVQMLKTRICARNINDKTSAFNTIADGISKGKLKPIYEIEQIEEEFKIYLAKDEFADEQRGFSFLADNSKLDVDLQQYIEDGEKEGLPTGYKTLDRHFRFKEGSFNVILGHDNVGKSTLVWFLAVTAACLHDWKWIIYSPENKTYRIKKVMIDFVLGQKSEQVSRVKFERAKEFVDSHFYFIRKDKEHTVFDLLNYGAVLCQKDPMIKGFMIDPYNSLKMDYQGKGKGLSAYEYHLKAATNMRIFAEKHCSVYMNAHSVTGSRRGMLDAEGILKRPRKDDIEQGGLWANRCDDFIVIHRKVKSEDEWMFTEIHMDKVKDVETGGSVTYDEPVKLKLMFFSDFIDEYGNSPLDNFRKEYFKVGTQSKIEINYE